MKTCLKITTALIMCLIVVFSFCITSFATSETIEGEQENVPENTFTLEDVTFIFKYTSDSVVFEGLTYQTYTDPISGTSGVELIPNFGIGYVIYNDPETETIDGIRINGAEVTSLRIPMDSENPTLEYVVAVRTAYAEGASGSLAQILDGTYDYSKLLTNPIFLFQLLYWIFMAISGFIGFIAIVRSKNKKVKTSDEIASKVSEKADTLEERILDIVTKTVKSEILPLAQASVESGKEAVKAILLSTSKSKDAPTALLDLFKESSDIDISNIVDEVRDALCKEVSENTAKHLANLSTLKNIANHVIQEDVSNATETTEITETAETKDTSIVQKSIF